MEYRYDFRHVLLINTAAILVSCSAIFAKLITLSPGQITFFRCGLTAIVLAGYLRIRRKNIISGFKQRPGFFLFSGVLLGLHWAILFKAVHVSNVSVAILAVFSYPVMTTLLEPLFFNMSLIWINLVTASMVLLGIFFLVPEYDLNNKISFGIFLGLISAFLIAIRNLWTKKYITKNSPSEIMFFQTFFAAAVFFPSLFFDSLNINLQNIYYLMAMAVVGTVLGHNLFVYSLKFFRTSTASVITSIQPLYVVGLAIIFLNESPKVNIYIGGVFIVGAVLVENILAGLKRKY